MSAYVVDRVLRAREGGHVKRCHCIPFHGEYTVATHTFQMLVLLEELHPAPTLALMRAILTHDLHERWTGDTPGCAKFYNAEFGKTVEDLERKIRQKVGYPALDALSQADGCWLRSLDKVELLLWAHDQEAMGNQNQRVLKENVEEWIGTNWDIIPLQIQLFLKEFRWDRTQEVSVEE
jgi:5'-deoxynucleotidase YfbR-like HD superfamily hydrolase